MKQTFLEQFFQQVRENPDQPALEDAFNGTMSFRELAGWSGKVMRWLIKRGIGTEDFVVIHLPRTVYAVAAMLGVLRSGAAFTMAETGFATGRLKYITEDCGAKCVLDEAAWEEIAQEQDDFGDTYRKADLHDAAFIVYTSGSTGNPKGCLHEYGTVEWIIDSYYYEGAIPVTAGKYALVIPMNVISTIHQLVTCLVTGVTLSIIPLELTRTPSAMINYFIQHHIDCTCLSPTLVRLLRGSLDMMKFIAIGSERADGVYLDNCDVINYYASSESGCCVSAYRITERTEEVPIGKPQFDLEYRIRPLEDGEDTGTGELMIRVPYFRGYLRLPEQTARVLEEDHWLHTGDIVSERPDGNLLILGRVDNMVKINGNRVEPEEVEITAQRALGLQAAAVKAFGEGDHARLCLYYVNGTEIDPAEAGEILKEHLPYYMMPSYYVRLSKLPRLVGGKVDRKVLEPPEMKEAEDAGKTDAADELESRLCRAMSRVLKGRPVSVNDDFYLLGGDSLGTVAAIGESHIPGLDMNDMLTGRTPRQIAALYRRRMREKAGNREAMNREAMAQAWPLTDNQEAALTYRRLRMQSTMYDLYMLSGFSERLDMERFAAAVVSAFRAHPAMLTVLREEDGEWKQVYRPEEFRAPQVEEVSQEEFDRLRETLIKPLDILNGEMFRVRLLRTPETDYAFLHVSHLLTDGTSVNILFRDILRAYRGETLPTDEYYLFLKEEAEKKASPLYQEAKAYYEEHYGDGTRARRPKEDFPAGGDGLTPGELTFSLDFPEKPVICIRETRGMGRNAVLSTALGLATAIRNSTDRVCIAWAYNGRKTGRDRDLVGMLFRNLPLKLDLADDLPMAELYRSAHDQMVRAVTYDCYLFNKTGVRPVKDDRVMMLFQEGIYNNEAEGFTVTPMALPDPYAASNSVMDFEVVMTDADHAECRIHYNADLYSPESVTAFYRLFERIVREMLSRAEDDAFTFGDLKKLC